MDDSAEILFQSFLQEALVNSSAMGRDVISLLLSIQHFLCRPRRRTTLKVPWRIVWGGCRDFNFTYPNRWSRWDTTDDFTSSFFHFFCPTLPSGTWRTPGLSVPWCFLPTSFSVCLVFFPLSLCLARWLWPDLMNGRHDHTTVFSKTTEVERAERGLRSSV